MLVELAYTVAEEAFQLNESQTDVKNFLPLFVVLYIKLFKHYIEGWELMEYEIEPKSLPLTEDIFPSS